MGSQKQLIHAIKTRPSLYMFVLTPQISFKLLLLSYHQNVVII